MNRRLLSLLLLAFASPLFAVVPNPYTVGLGFSFNSTGAPNPGGTGLMYVYAEQTASVGSSLGYSGATVESVMANAWLKPGKTYTVTFMTLGCSPSQFKLSFVAPEGFTVWVNGSPVDIWTQSVNPPWTIPCNFSYTVRVEPVNDGFDGPAGSFSGIRMGKSVAWGVGLGSLRGGQSAGFIDYRLADLAVYSTASRSALNYSAPPNSSQITTVNSGGYLRQVMTPQVLVDLVDDPAGGFWINPTSATGDEKQIFSPVGSCK